MPDAFDDRCLRQAPGFGVQQPDLVASIDQRAADHQQAEGDLMACAEVGGERLVRRVDQQDLH
jgi:hypothetical protein